MVTKIDYGRGTFSLDNFLSTAECSQLITTREQVGFEEAMINTRQGQQMFKDIRNNDRQFFDDYELADQLFKRLEAFLPADIDGRQLHGLNERFRIYRYTAGQYFKKHRDGCFRRAFHEENVSGEEESAYTFMVYLNDGFEGGATSFDFCQVAPKTGSALLFPHRLIHEGQTITSGVKYVLRTDVMYRQYRT